MMGHDPNTHEKGKSFNNVRKKMQNLIYAQQKNPAVLDLGPTQATLATTLERFNPFGFGEQIYVFGRGNVPCAKGRLQ